MTEENRALQSAEPRVVTHRLTGRMGEGRRRMFNRHLLLFLGVNLAVAALDIWQSPRLDWAWWLLLVWTPIFLLHMLGLNWRGYSMGELLTPAKSEVVETESGAPFDYELIRSRQLRDGIADAIEAVRGQDGQLASDALAAADDLLGALEGLVMSTRERADAGTDKTAARLEPQLSAAVEALNDLHIGLIGVSVLQAPAEEVPLQQARERAEALRKL